MTYDEVMAALEGMGTAQNRKIYARHGASEPMFGVSYANLGKLEKTLRKADDADQLAERLWASGNHDARILASKIVDRGALRAKVLDAWVKDATNHVLVGAVAGVAAGSPHAMSRMRKWQTSRNEWVAAVGWCIVSELGDDERLGEEDLEGMIATIERDIHGAKNRVRHNMNGALIALGVRSAGLRRKAVAAAKRIGEVEVDHGETSCKTPDAVSYIEKTVAHRKAMAERRAAKKAPKKKAAKKKAPKRASRTR